MTEPREASSRNRILPLALMAAAALVACSGPNSNDFFGGDPPGASGTGGNPGGMSGAAGSGSGSGGGAAKAARARASAGQPAATQRAERQAPRQRERPEPKLAAAPGEAGEAGEALQVREAATRPVPPE
jgi:hypothetical protein